VKQQQQQNVFDPFNNNQVVNGGGNDVNWMIDNKNPNGKNNNSGQKNDFDQNIWNFDFIENNNSKNNSNNSLSKSNNSSANFNDIQNIFQTNAPSNESPIKKPFDFPSSQNAPQQNNFGGFDFTKSNSNNFNGNPNNNQKNNNNIVNVNTFNSGHSNNSNNSYNVNNNNISKSPITTPQQTSKGQQQDIYDFFK